MIEENYELFLTKGQTNIDCEAVFREEFAKNAFDI